MLSRRAWANFFFDFGTLARKNGIKPTFLALFTDIVVFRRMSERALCTASLRSDMMAYVVLVDSPGIYEQIWIGFRKIDATLAELCHPEEVKNGTF